MKLYTLLAKLDNSPDQFNSLEGFFDYTESFLGFIHDGGMQADIVAKNDHRYHFYQYGEEVKYATTRPINMELFIPFEQYRYAKKEFINSLKNLQRVREDLQARENLNRFIYTCQQSIGAGYDAYNNPNKARKQNGNLFEMLIRLVLKKAGINVDTGIEELPVGYNLTMSFQHDVIIKNSTEEITAIGQLKTSSKDRIDKIFLDKFMYNKLKKVDIPHFAIFLNDIQRQGKLPKPGIGSTFLPGHFRAYTMALNPLDGVYYVDIRPNMLKDDFLKKHIKKLDSFLCEDVWKYN